MVKMQKVMIKGTKDGLLLSLDDSCSFSELLIELEKKLTPQRVTTDESHSVNVRIHSGNRYLTKEQQKKIRELLMKQQNLQITSFESDVILKKDADKIRRESEIHVITTMVRSGQILQVVGDLVLVGDVNPGGKVVASGNIYVVGALKGMAHAGCHGNEEAVIVASKMSPTQLRIANSFSRAPDLEELQSLEAEFAYVNDLKQIVIDRLVYLKKIRPNLSQVLEGGA